MPLDGGGTASKPSGTTAASGATISSSAFNSVIDDIYSIFNTARPIAYGGTGAATAVAANDALDVAGADIATASTINLDNATGPFVKLTGTTTVSTVTLGSGKGRMAYAAGAFQLTASANLIVNGSTSVNYTTAAGDLLIFRGMGSSVVRVWAISPTAWAAITGTPTTLSGYGITDAISATSGNPAIPGALCGLTLSNDGTTPASKIDIAAGQAASDDTIPTLMILGSALIKDISSSWSVGSGNGSLDTGTVANGTYHVFLIMRPDTGVVDVLTSTSASSPTMPANYTKKRRIGSIIRSGGNIVKFAQFGDMFFRDVPSNDAAVTNPGTSRVTVTLSVPVGIVVSALVVGYIFNSATAAARSLLFTSPSQTDTTPTNALFNARTEASTGLNSIGSAQVLTNTSAQICYRLDVSDSNTVAKVETMGWIDTRGRT